MQQEAEWREILHEYIIFGMLFKALAHDAALKESSFKLSYRSFQEAASIWAEREHHKYRRQFVSHGGKVHLQEKRDDFNYYVLVSVKGYQHENFYNVEILRAECQVRLDNWIKGIIKV